MVIDCNIKLLVWSGPIYLFCALLGRIVGAKETLAIEMNQM